MSRSSVVANANSRTGTPQPQSKSENRSNNSNDNRPKKGWYVTPCLNEVMSMELAGYQVRRDMRKKAMTECDNVLLNRLIKYKRSVLRAKEWHDAFVQRMGRAPLWENVDGEVESKRLLPSNTQYAKSMYKLKQGAAAPRPAAANRPAAARVPRRTGAKQPNVAANNNSIVNTQGRPVANQCLRILMKIERLGYTGTRASTRAKVMANCGDEELAGVKKTLRGVMNAKQWHDEFVQTKGREPTEEDLKQATSKVRQYANNMYFMKRKRNGPASRNPAASRSRSSNRSGPATKRSRSSGAKKRNAPASSRGKKRAADGPATSRGKGKKKKKVPASSSSAGPKIPSGKGKKKVYGTSSDSANSSSAMPAVNGHVQMYIARLQALHGNRWPIVWDRQQRERLQREANARANARGRPFRMTSSRPDDW